jgi:hypothetical protein
MGSKPVISVTLQAEVGGSPILRSAWVVRSNFRNKKAGGTVQVVEYLPHKCEALGSKKKKKKGRKEKKALPPAGGLEKEVHWCSTASEAKDSFIPRPGQS